MRGAGPRELVVIGGGAAGTAAALWARENGLDVVLVEARERWARHLAEVALAEELAGRPLSRAPTERVAEGFRQAVRRAGETAAASLDRRDRLLARADVARVVGFARLSGEPGVVEIDGGAGSETLRAKSVLLASGSRPELALGAAVPREAREDRLRLLDESPPATVVVVGGGREGVSLAGLLTCAGCDVTLVEAQPRLLGDADPDVSAAVRRSLEAVGARVLVGRAVSTVSVTGSRRRVGIDGVEGGIEVDRVLVAGGRVPDLDGFGIDLASIVSPPVQAQSYGTALPWLFVTAGAAGRSGTPETAQREGRAAVAAIIGRPIHVPHRAIPCVVAGIGGGGWVGLTEPEARAAGHSLLVGRAKLAGRGPVLPGFVKLIADAGSQRILGVHVAGARAREAVDVAAAVVEFQVSRPELGGMAFPAGSPAEALAEAAWSATAP